MTERIAGTSSSPMETELDSRENSIGEKDGLLRPSLKSRLRDIPDRVQKSFVEIDGKYYFAGRPDSLAFEDLGRRIKTGQDNPRVTASMVDIAEAKGWERIRVRGKEDFRREVWLHAASRGIEVKGYTPREEDLARLKKLAREQKDKEGGPKQPELVKAARGNAPQTEKAVALRDGKEDLVELARENPDLVNEIAAIKMGEKLSRSISSEADRQRFMDRVRERVADNYLKGQEPAGIKVKEERTIERPDRVKEVENER